MVFAWFFGSFFTICLTILCMPIPIIYFLHFLAWGFHNHFVRIRYMIRDPLGRTLFALVHFCIFHPITTSHPICVFPFVREWYANDRSCVKCGFWFFTIVAWIFSIKVFSVASEMCSLVSTRVGPLYITSPWLFYSRLGFSYFGHTSGIHIIH